MKLFRVLIPALMPLLIGSTAAGQLPDKFENLQFLPKTISPDSLTQIMRGFSFALGVRCQSCHSGGDGLSFEGVNFPADDKPAKRKARYMLTMVDRINGELLAGIEHKADPAVKVHCATCHRGSALPKSIEQVLAETIRKDGAPAAVARYKQLRESTMVQGKYDFGEWSINELARKLVASGDTTSAIAMFEMNAGYYPQSVSIDLMLAHLYRAKGDVLKAIARVESVLQRQPNNPEARRLLEQLRR